MEELNEMKEKILPRFIAVISNLGKILNMKENRRKEHESMNENGLAEGKVEWMNDLFVIQFNY